MVVLSWVMVVLMAFSTMALWVILYMGSWESPGSFGHKILPTNVAEVESELELSSLDIDRFDTDVDTKIATGEGRGGEEEEEDYGDILRGGEPIGEEEEEEEMQDRGGQKGEWKCREAFGVVYLILIAQSAYAVRVIGYTLVNKEKRPQHDDYYACLADSRPGASAW
eukprot:jgi/Bigna1/77917/fgenesh1_pg.51_\